MLSQVYYTATGKTFPETIIRLATSVRPSPPPYLCSHGTTCFPMDKYFVKVQFFLKPLAKY
jgi:hypothetical protein